MDQEEIAIDSQIIAKGESDLFHRNLEALLHDEKLKAANFLIQTIYSKIDEIPEELYLKNKNTIDSLATQSIKNGLTKIGFSDTSYKDIEGISPTILFNKRLNINTCFSLHESRYTFKLYYLG